ncbi:hypothetical protein LX64_02351 [Chitinophaga skermanii]|uniref:Uncharacterized protein n=1 Tax=Chitinophaga skermanii TaxID=331697 RepID=A0A327QTW8_9BACT|nr:hypothetical protein [Chitinophaga skermanii]RAJ05197.1 hypothetical protein LX64_02351 [Chitinophaga skermanii]
MNDNDIRSAWQSYSQLLNDSLQLNKQNAEDITKLKAKSFLQSMQPIKIFTVAVGILWVLFVFTLLVGSWSYSSLFFKSAALIQGSISAIAIIIYLYQLYLIQQVDINQPVMAAQRIIAQIKTSTIWVTRILFLQLPIWTTFYLTAATFQNGQTGWHIVQIIITGAFTLAALWLFFNIKYENRHTKWFQLIFNGKDWSPLMQAMSVLEQVEEEKV